MNTNSSYNTEKSFNYDQQSRAGGSEKSTGFQTGGWDDMKNVQVAVRIRPLLAHETQRNDMAIV